MNCYVLVGGLSRRMGRPKAELPFGDSTFFERVAQAAGPVFQEVVAVGREGDFRPPGHRFLIEPDRPVRAPVLGVLQALSDAGGRCFVLAVDYPLITTAILAHLREAFEKTAAPMLVPLWRERAQMLCAGYSASLLPVLERRVTEGRLDLRGLIEEAGAEMIPEQALRDRFPGEPLMNVNTPGELEEAGEHDGR